MHSIFKAIAWPESKHSWAHKHHTQRKQHQPWNWIKDSLLFIQKHLYMGVLHKFSACSLLFLLNEWFWIMLQCTSEGVYIRFPSQTLKLSNIDLNIYLPALNLINASYLFKTRAYGSRSDKSYKRRSFIKDSLKACATIPKHFSKIWFCFSSWTFAWCAGSLAELAMLLHQYGAERSHKPPVC